LGQLPADLWVTRLPAALRDRAPHIEERDGQAVWICDGKVWGSWVGKPAANGAARPVKPLYNAFDRAQIYDQSERRPAVAELRLVAAKGGVRQVNLMIANIKPKLDDPAWAPLWSLLEETGIILSWHITVFVGKPGDRVAGKPASVFENTKFFMANFLEPFVDLFAWGILERHPKLRLVMAEAGTGWLPWLVQDLDYRHWRLWEAKEFWVDKGGIALETKPSELFKRQIYATFQEDEAAMSL